MNDFSDNSSELDKYGVWVKKPASDTAKETPAVEEPTVDASFIEQSAATDLEIEQDLAEFDIDSLSETPVIDEPTIEEPAVDDTTMENISMDDFTTESVPEEPAAEESVSEEPAFDVPAVETQDMEAETSISENELSLDDFAIDSIDDDNGPMTFEADQTPAEEPAVTEAADDTPDTTEEVSFEDGEIDLDAFMNDGPAPTAESTPDGDVDLSAFMDDSSAPGQDGEVDLSAFMGDGGDAPDFGNGDIDLEAFMGSEGFASDKMAQEEIEDTDPLDIDLDFEENDDLELQDTEANGDLTGIDQASSSSFTGMSETTEIEDFDALFDEIVDETPQAKAEPVAASPKPEVIGSTEEIDLSDFGFDDNSDNQNPILDDGKPEPKKQGPVDYEMNVDDDDTPSDTKETVVEQKEEEDDSSEDIEIDITQDNEASVQKEQETDLSSPDDSFDIDSILNSVEDESGETVSFGGEPVDTASFTEPAAEENFTAPSEEVKDNEPMFQEPQEPDFGEAFEEPALADEPTVIEEPVFEETSVEAPEDRFDISENEIDIPVFDETSVEEPTISSVPAEESAIEEASINLEDFMGEEGFTDGGPGVQGYDTVVQETEEPAAEEPATEEAATENVGEPSLETAFDEPAMQEPVVEETAAEETFVEEPAIEEPAIDGSIFDTVEETPASEAPAEMVTEETSFEEPAFETEENVAEEAAFEMPSFEAPAIEDSAFETADETVVETSAEMVYNEEKSAENENFSVDDFMGKEGFTDGGPGVQGYDTVAQDNTQEAESESEAPEEINMNADFDDSDFSDKMEEPETTEAEDEGEPMSDVTEEPTIDGEPDYSSISAFADKQPEYDMTGVTLTLDDFANIKEYPEEPSVEESVIEEPVIEESSVSEDEVIQDEVETYSVFIKNESSAEQAVNAGTAAEENDISTDETVAEEASVSTEETMDSFDSSSVLSQISEELASLRTEIKDLKSEFEEIKKNGVKSETDLEENEVTSSEIENTVELPEPAEDTGFFNDTDEDDTIALSGDELSNILSTAEFTKPEETVEDGLKMDFDNEELEEPVFNEGDLDLSDPDGEEGEISVPTVDDILVESSSTDLMDNTITTDEDGQEEMTQISDDDIPSPTLESLDIPPYEQEEELTEGNIEYLKDENVEEDENLETGISEQPVNSVFNSWDAASEPEMEEPVLDEPIIEEPVIEETAVSESEVEVPEVSASNEIPASMKEEIKSVLSYMDQLLENLPEDKIAEFAQSEQFETYKKLFAELGLS